MLLVVVVVVVVVFFVFVVVVGVVVVVVVVGVDAVDIIVDWAAAADVLQHGVVVVGHQVAAGLVYQRDDGEVLLPIRGGH